MPIDYCPKHNRYYSKNICIDCPECSKEEVETETELHASLNTQAEVYGKMIDRQSERKMEAYQQTKKIAADLMKMQEK